MGKRQLIIKSILAVVLGIVVLITGCNPDIKQITDSQGNQTTTETKPVTTGNDKVVRPSGWTSETHSNNVDPNYDIVFPKDEVNEIKITIAPEDWQAMQDNMTQLFGAPGAKQQGPAGGGLPGGAGMTPVNPMWVTATVEFNGETWTNVGYRYKGNSSLRSGWNSGTLILPFKLDFDQYENEYPGINDQRFYGFKQLSFSNAFHDSTYMHDKIASDLLEEAGLVAAETAYYEVILDYGEGITNLGLYVMIEVVDDTVISRFFDDDSGNIYEADGAGVTLAAGTTLMQIQNSFNKENNINSGWGDIEALYNTLHSSERISNPVDWRENLESIFDVDVFLKWLALSAIIQNWDNYGSMSHNFYIYHDPETDQLTWISWDHNEILGVSGGGVAPIGKRSNVSLDKKDIGQKWPLIRFLLDDQVYYDRYIGFLSETINEVFIPDKLKEKCLETAELIAPFAAKNGSITAFNSAVQQMINRIYERYQTTTNFLIAEGG